MRKKGKKKEKERNNKAKWKNGRNEEKTLF